MEAVQSTLNQPENSQNQNAEPQAVVVRREAERELIAWIAPSRPFKRRDKQFFVTTFAMAGIVGLILFLAEGIMPVLLIISLVFLYYILSTVEPENIEYRLTTKGVKIANKLTPWHVLNHFWFSKRFDSELLVIDTIIIPGRMELVIDSSVKEKLKKEISAYIPEELHEETPLDKLISWVTSKIPGNA